VLIYLTSEA